MKKLLLFLFLIFSFYCKAQTSVYHPFPDSNAYWCQTDQWYDGSCDGINNYTTFFSTDTTIGSHVYHKLQTSGNHFSGLCGGDGNYYYCCSLIRQDASQRKVFTYDTSLHVDTILYDFNLQIGDTLDRRNIYWPQSSLPVYIISSIDSILINGQYRRRFNFSGCPSFPPCPDSSIIEGIGCTFGLSSFCDCFEYQATLNSFKQNGATIYPNSSAQCDVISGIKNISVNNNSITISPNPAHDNFTITLNGQMQNGELKIYDVMGRVMHEQMINTKQETINCKLNAGIYFVKMMDGEKIFTLKLVVE